MFISRRAVIGGVAGLVGTAAIARAARSSRSSLVGARALRVGVMSNLTHAPILAGIHSGRIARALAPTPIDTRVFRAGPRVTEALIGDAIDVGTAGPAAVVVHHARHRASSSGGLRILAGCCSGGASLITRDGSAITTPRDLAGKRVAITQIGTTQDIALRVFLRDAGLHDVASGGATDSSVTVLAIAPATILDQMKRGELHAAWLPEPWATRLVVEIGATRFIDERDRWPYRRFASAVLACRRTRAAEPAIEDLTLALAEEVTLAQKDPEATLRLAHAELSRHVGNPGSSRIWQAARQFVDFTSDPIPSSITSFGDAASSFRLCPPHPTHGLLG